MAAPLSEAAKWWYNVTAMKQNITGAYYTPIQLKMPLEIERMIEVNDPVYTFHEVMSHIDLNKYLVEEDAALVLRVHEPARAGGVGKARVLAFDVELRDHERLA